MYWATWYAGSLPSQEFAPLFSFLSSWTVSSESVWSNSLMIPAYFAGLSTLAILVHLLSSTRYTRRTLARLFGLNYEQPQDWTPDPADSHVTGGFWSDIHQRAIALGGISIFVFRVARFVSCLVLLALAIVSVVDQQGDINQLGKKHKHHRYNFTPAFTDYEWLQVAMCITYAYASIIALMTICARKKLANLVNAYLVWLLFIIWSVYAYRNLYPLATFTLSPIDIGEGWLLWMKLGVLSFAAVAIPLCVPTQYTPFDPRDPKTSNPEQTASWISFLTFSFLDPIVFKASRVSHLPVSEYPPLADYDFAKNLVKYSLPYLDPMSVLAKRGLFFGLMKIFRKDYFTMTALVFFRTIFVLLNPVAIKQLLNYLENDGNDAFFRPWVWIATLFFAPVLGSALFQWYIFLTTRGLTRAQCIITQLVFEHSLRIRMKAETKDLPRSEASTVVSSPDTASFVDEADSPTDSSNSDDAQTASSTTIFSASTANSVVETGRSKKRSGSSIDDGAKKMPTPESQEASADLIGKINNLVSTDLANIIEGRDFLLVVFAAPLQIVICTWLLYTILDWSAFVGMTAMVVLFPIPGYIANLMQTVQKQKMKTTDARVQTVTEAMNVIRMIKLFGWERKMNDKLAEKRDEELRYQKKRQLLEVLNGFINFIIPVITMLASFACYTLIMKKDLTASRVFSAMSVFDTLRETMFMIFGLIPAIIQAKVSLNRVDEFLHKTELLDSFSPEPNDLIIAENADERKSLIGFRNAAFTWSNEVQGPLSHGSSRRNFTLRIDEELIFKKGKINLIVGPTGSGKTSLLMALLGELHFVPSGPDSWYNLPRDGGVAYAAQESWVQNETLRENILFGAPLDEVRYKKVIDQCGLARDLTLFEAGDQTEVGEKGLSLSGGQKARITLARAVYSSAQILILDDVLAALDVHTSRWIIDKCFKGDLVCGRTVILVTHNVAMVGPIADFVISVGSHGQILSQGNLSAALKYNKDLVAEVESKKKELPFVNETLDSEALDVPNKPGSGKLIVAEEIAEGHVSYAALKLFFTAMGGSYAALFWSLVIIALILTELSNVGQTWFLGYWAAQYDTSHDKPVDVIFYLNGYTFLLFLSAVFYIFATWIFILGSLRASRTLHKALIQSILGTTLRWLDSTPVSRVIARCTQDMQAVDGPVSRYLSNLLEITLSMLFKFGAVVLVSPVFLFPGVGVAMLGAWCGQIYIRAQLCVKREMSNARSPVLGHFGAAMTGIVSIRAYQAQDAFRVEALKRTDAYTRPSRTFYNLNRWVGIRVDTLAALFSSALAAYFVYRPGAGHREGYAANTGFSLNMAVGFSSMILWWVRILNEFEVSGNSLERIQGYVTIEQEAKPTETGVPPAYWPASGEIRVENLSASYSPSGPKVLHDLTFHIRSGERVGVVGRTGSGKSSLTLSLLRCINTEGQVYFDNLPIDKINLDVLRSNITIIPQIPELISGTVRDNLDPFDQYDDSSLNDALRAAGLFSVQKEDDEGRITLDTSISSGGGNFSVGQRQILALARAIVRKSKLLILDEATSAIDYETDSVIQSSLRHGLGSDVTLFTIAHRLQTIMDADKIMLLDTGRIVEFGKPSELLKLKNGKLRSLVDESGVKETLYRMAQFQGDDQLD